ncbi:MAG TPA: methionine--tRNA ligase [Lachnospiraceae bacterium]|nr:methionine--tRNA ligase [Lachnospiraceae bacterium]
MRNILIGGAWPYANGSLHIGHIAGLLPGDVLARYHRAVGDNVYFVSGSDCHGTPVAIRAKKEGKTPEEISDSYHAEFVECFDWLGFSYDVYTKTSAEAHKDFVREFHKKLYESEYVYEKETAQAYCAPCGTFLADRFVVGKCPACGSDARGDQCDACGAVLEPENLTEARCAVCGKPIGFRNSRHLYIAVSKMERQLRKLEEERPQWRKNAIAFAERYIAEGLRDRALTRDLGWGISVPREGYEGKTIYIWAENVLGYLSASKVAADRREAFSGDTERSNAYGRSSSSREGERDVPDSAQHGNETGGAGRTPEESQEFEALWGENAKHYYVHGKDNIPFHTIILPALLIAHGGNWHLPDQIVSSEYMTLEGRKISTSQNYAVWVKELQQCCEPDSVRYFFLANGPEKKDADFSWREYVNSHNGELLGAYGNFVNRSLSFIQKYWDGIVPEGVEDAEISETIEQLFSVTGELIEKACFKDAIGGIFDFVRSANKYFDTQKPWATRESDEAACKVTLFQCVQIIANLAVLLSPFLPFSSEKICGWLGIGNRWEKQQVPSGYRLPETGILFQRIDKKATLHSAFGEAGLP